MRLLILSLLVAVTLAERVRYDGYQTLRIQPRDTVQHEYIHHLAETLDDRFDFWAHTKNAHTDVMVPPNLLPKFKELLKSNQIDYSVMIQDVQTLIDSEKSEASPDVVFDYGVYHTYDEIQQWVSDIAAEYAIATNFQIGTSGEGRAINALHISTGGTGKKAVYWQGGIHAREWISPATVMYLTQQILDNSAGSFKTFFDAFDFYIVPSLNVDGYSFTYTDDRMWRKTRRNNDGSPCFGVDPNRNYEYEWGGDGASRAACAETFRGPNANSEKCISDSTNFLLASGVEFVSFIDFHSYSQLWLAPWSYSEAAANPPDTVDQVAAAEAGVLALQAVHGTVYEYGPSANTLYAAAGCSEGWGYGVLGAKYSYVIELRDTGEYGFILPESQIIPTGDETFEGMKAYLQYVVDNS